MKQKTDRWITADRIYDGKGGEIPDAAIGLSADGTITEIVPVSSMSDQGIVPEVFAGALCPGFINSHCHLELSHLQNEVPRGTGLVPFLKTVTGLRNVKFEEKEALIKKAEAQMWSQGIVACGDISNSADTVSIKKSSAIRYYTFVEIFGMTEERANNAVERGLDIVNQFTSAGLQCSLSPHAPYSAHKTLLRSTSDRAIKQHQPISIHMQESEAEGILFREHQGDFIEFYNSIGMEMAIPEKSTSSLAYTLDVVDPEVNLILVHNTMANQDHVDLAAQRKKTFWCFCPKANLYIEERLPQFELWNKYPDRILVGTDSLASNDKFSILEELVTIGEAGESFDMAELIRFACWNPATFFGWTEDLGSLEIGKRPGLNHISFASNSGQPGMGSELAKIC